MTKLNGNEQVTTATTTKRGVVKVDGTSVTIDADGTIRATGEVPASRRIDTSAPLTGGGDLSANRTLGVSIASPSAVGVVKPDGVTITEAADGTLTAVPQSNPQYPINALVSGGGVVWVSGYTFTVSAATYLINGTLYSSPLTTVTLGASDPSLDRIDVIAVGTTGAAVVLAGTPATDPQQPTLDPSTQLELTFVYVTAATTSPTQISSVTVYDENVEWTTSGSTSFNFADTTHPYHGTKDISVAGAANGNFGQFQSGSAVNLSQYNTLGFYIQSKASWPKQKSLQIQWYNGTAAVGTAVTLNDGAFSFSSANTTAYQQIVIPLSSFAIPSGVSPNILKLTVNGAGANIGFYADLFVLQAGTSTSTPSNAMVWQGAWNSTHAYAKNDVVTNGGNTWIALQASTNITPAAGAYWAQVATLTGGGGSGTVTSVSVATANGFQGTVATPATTPAITLNVDASHYLPTTTDEANWNAKQAAGNYITALTGDVTATGPGSVAATLASVGTPGTYTKVTTDAKGRVSSGATLSAADIPNIAESQVTNLTADLAAKAPLASPALTGTPTAPTAAPGTNTTQIATTAFVESAIPSALPPSGAAGGDLSGTYPNPTVTATHLTAPLPVAQGGTGTATPGIVAGSNVTVTGTWPNQTVSASSGSSGITQLTGDVTAGPGSGSQVATLAASGVTAGTYVNPTLTVDAKGRVTSAVNGSGTEPYDMVSGYVGKPSSGATVMLVTAVRPITIPANFAASVGSVGANPSATATYSALKNGATVGSISISTAGLFSFSTLSGAPITLVAGDRFAVTAPATQDATLSDVAFTITGTR